MATKMTAVLEYDLDGGPADETVRFGVGGTGYEIGLSTKNATAFRRQLAPCIEHAPRWAEGGADRGADCPLAGHAVPTSGPGRKTTALRSATVAARLSSSTKPP